MRRSPQLGLDLKTRPRWGGVRPGAGRKPGPKPVMRHVRRRHFGSLTPAHVTLRVRADVPSLRSVRIVHEVERTFADGCERRDFRLVHDSLQGNHAHLIVEARDRTALGRGMMALGARLARAVNRVERRSGAVLDDRYHAHLLRTPREVHRALRYVLLNARRHGLRSARTALRAAKVLLDPASSARWFDGWRKDSRAAIEARPDPTKTRSSVARPRHWLLRVGWRRHGLIDPGDVPGGRAPRPTGGG